MLVLVTCAACSGGRASDAGSDAGTDAGSGVDSGPPFSLCGQPGDPGNSKGVGQYCLKSSDCTPTAPVCSSVANDPSTANLDTFFCVLPCDPCAVGFCAEDAVCVCRTNECGCVPTRCSAIIPDGGPPSCDAGIPDAGSDAGFVDAGDGG